MDVSDEEIARLRKRLRDDPRSLAFVPLAEALRRTGRSAEALSIVRAGLRHRPEHPAARVVLARLHLDAGARTLAQGVLHDVVRADPQNVAAGALLAELWIADGRLREAKELVQRLADDNPGDPTFPALLERASPTLRPLHGDPGDPFDTEGWAEGRVRAGDYPRAVRAWRRIEAHNPGEPRARERVAELDRVLAARAGLAAPRDRGLGGAS